MDKPVSSAQHAALWLIGPDMPGLLSLGAKWVADHGGNIEKDIADKFGEKFVIFMSITAKPADIARMEQDRAQLERESGCGIVFQPMQEPAAPEGFQEELHGFDVVTDDAIGVIAQVTALLEAHGVLIMGHTGERRVIPGPKKQAKGGQKFLMLLPHGFDHGEFNLKLSELVKKHNGQVITSLRPVPGLLWWW